jgi:hypothetical protein
VVGVPECLEALFANRIVGGGVHEDHDKEHKMASDASRLGVVDIESLLLANLWNNEMNTTRQNRETGYTRVRSTLMKLT